MLYIRADGNSQIGAGHLMRCLSIADAAAKQEMVPVFLLADEQGRGLVEGRGYTCRILSTDHTRMMEELPALTELLQRDPAPFVLIDSYAADRTYLQAVSKLSKTAYLDDFGSEAYAVDLVINYNIYAMRLSYDTLYAGTKVQLLLGSNYAPLRKDFEQVTYTVRDKVEHILITTGGADQYNVAGQLAEQLVQCLASSTDLLPQIHIVSGPFHGFLEQLRQLAAACPAIRIHENVTEMSELIRTCDLAISAAGSTLYELCAIGVPTIYFYFVKNQELPARYFAQDTDMYAAGHYALDAAGTLDRMVEESVRLLHDKEERHRIAKSMQTVTDGRGAERIAEAIRRNMVI